MTSITNKKRKKSWYDTPKQGLIEEIKRLEFTVKRRGYQIGGLYWVLQCMLEANPATYTLGSVAADSGETAMLNMKQELQAARDHVRATLGSRATNSNTVTSNSESGPTGKQEAEDSASDLPHNFQCNICFESFDKEEHRPVALDCGHVLCQGCLIKYTEKNKDAGCPSCKRPIQKILILYV